MPPPTNCAAAAVDRWFDLDGGPGDRHRILIEDGEIWGWENVQPRNPIALKAALLAGVRQYHTYAVAESSRTNSERGVK